MLSLLLACTSDPEPTPAAGSPLGIPLVHDGVLYAGAAAIDVTPEIRETFTDLDGDSTWDGDEPYVDADGSGTFDPVWIAGYGPLRPANGVHDPVWARAVVVAIDGEYVALVGLDLVGLGHPRIWQARDALVADGFAPERLIVSSTHDHQGPDTMGLWGNPIGGIPGFDPAYQDRIAQAIEQAVRDAAAAMVPVDLTVGRVAMRDRGPWMNGPRFGGKNPDERFHGMIHDGRDPVVVSDQLLVLQGVGDAGTVFTLTNWSGHPEVRSESNNDLSSDWVGVTRAVLEAEYGGIAVHLPESLGGMQSALNGQLPLVLDDGTHVLATCDAAAVADPADADCFGQPEGADRIDADGDHVPVWAEQDSWAFVTSHGWAIAEAAIDALAAGAPVTGPLRVDREPFVLPISNEAYNVLGPIGLFDIGLDQAITDSAACPEVSDDVLGCFEAHVFRLELGPVGFLSVPGELLPELAWGLPTDDPRWVTEAADPAARGADATYFWQHDPDCTATVPDYEACRDTLAIGDCDCLTLHAWPYRLSDQPGRAPLLDHLDTEYRAMIGMADSYFSYVIPEPDFNRAVSLFTDDGDHYEDTVSAASVFADRVLDAHQRLADRWAR
ncbi:MAG: hypothetical protein ABMB14_14725 [Myxococcota bacterium]